MQSDYWWAGVLVQERRGACILGLALNYKFEDGKQKKRTKRQHNKIVNGCIGPGEGHPGSCAQLEEQRGVIGGCPSGPADKINWNLGKFTTRPTEKLRENVT